MISPAAAVFSIALLASVSTEIPNFDRVLLPMHNGDARGAYGSVWKVDDVIFNQSDEEANFYPHFFLGDFFEATVWSLLPGRKVLVDEINEPMGCRNCPPPPHPGGILYLQHDHADRFVMYQRVYEANVDGDNHGAVVPAVRAADFRTGRTTFPSIPMGDNFRSTLRIYNLQPEPRELSVRVVSGSPGQETLLSQGTVALPAAYGVPTSTSAYLVPLRPGYVQLSIEALASSAQSGPVRVILDAADGDAEYWAFVSVTSNSASRVTVFVP